MKKMNKYIPKREFKDSYGSSEMDREYGGIPKHVTDDSEIENTPLKNNKQ